MLLWPTALINSKELCDAIDHLAETLYMPDNAAEMMENDFISPVVAAMCLRALAPEGGFLRPKLITVNAVPIECGIRQCIFMLL